MIYFHNYVISEYTEWPTNQATHIGLSKNRIF